MTRRDPNRRSRLHRWPPIWAAACAGWTTRTRHAHAWLRLTECAAVCLWMRGTARCAPGSAHGGTVRPSAVRQPTAAHRTPAHHDRQYHHPLCTERTQPESSAVVGSAKDAECQRRVHLEDNPSEAGAHALCALVFYLVRAWSTPPSAIGIGPQLARSVHPTVHISVVCARCAAASALAPVPLTRTQASGAALVVSWA